MARTIHGFEAIFFLVPTRLLLLTLISLRAVTPNREHVLLIILPVARNLPEPTLKKAVASPLRHTLYDGIRLV